MDIMQIVVIATQICTEVLKKSGEGKPIISPPKTLPTPTPAPEIKAKKAKKVKTKE